MKAFGLQAIGATLVAAILSPPLPVPSIAQAGGHQTSLPQTIASLPRLHVAVASGSLPTKQAQKPAVVAPIPAGRPHTVRVKPNGAFEPQNILIKVGDTVRWEQLDRKDAIVQIEDPGTALEVCGVKKNFPHRFDSSDANEFTGPTRLAVSGIFALGPNGPGFKEINRNDPGPWKCNCESSVAGCGDQFTKAGDFKLCPDEGGAYDFLQETWDNPDITGVTIRLNWSDIQQDVNGNIVFVWNDLDRQMNKAVQHGKLFTLDVRAGSHGTPKWIFTDYRQGPHRAPPGPVTPLNFKDWSDGDAPANNCGYDMKLGSPADDEYRNLYVAMIRELARHVASDSRWFQAVAYVKASGANFISSEARLPKRCPDEDGDGKIDTINGDACFCNTKHWADAGYTPEGLYKYYRAVESAIYEAFFQRKSINYQLIQDGFPRVSTATNFLGDYLNDHRDRPFVQPRGTIDDDIAFDAQTVTVLTQGAKGAFVLPFRDPLVIALDRTHRSEGYMFVPQHSGLQRLPDDYVSHFKCLQHQDVDPTNHRASFPIPADKEIDNQVNGCPNFWAVREGVANGQIMGFQTTNNHTGFSNGAGAVDSPAHVESALWNLTINSNGVFVELYEERLWEIFKLMGGGESASPLSTNGRANLNPAYSKNLHEWMKELHDRRRTLANRYNDPNVADPFPNVWEHKFSKPISQQKVYHYINPAKCSSINGPARVATIIVQP